VTAMLFRLSAGAGAPKRDAAMPTKIGSQSTKPDSGLGNKLHIAHASATNPASRASEAAGLERARGDSTERKLVRDLRGIELMRCGDSFQQPCKVGNPMKQIRNVLSHSV
jgi:hypothetical protein